MHIRVILLLVLVINSEWFQSLWSYMLLLKPPILMRFCFVLWWYLLVIVSYSDVIYYNWTWVSEIFNAVTELMVAMSNGRSSQSLGAWAKKEHIVWQRRMLTLQQQINQRVVTMVTDKLCIVYLLIAWDNQRGTATDYTSLERGKRSHLHVSKSMQSSCRI